MFNIGFSEFLVIRVVALLVIGPKQLPEVARVVGRLIGEFRKATQDLSGGLLEVTKDVKSTIDETKQTIVNEGKKVVDDVTEGAMEEFQDAYHDHDHHDHHALDHQDDHEEESLEAKKDESLDGKS